MAAIELQIIAETLPEGVCGIITSEQDRLNTYADHLRAAFPGTITGISVGATPPDDLSKAWLKLNANGYPERLYYYANGAWQSKHPKLPGEIVIWDNALPDFSLFDGGDGGAIGPSSGPMWEEVEELRARVPIGAGTFPSSEDNPAGTGETLEVTDTGGQQIIKSKVQEHIHVVGRFHAASGDDGNDPQLLMSTLSTEAPTGSARELSISGVSGSDVNIQTATGKHITASLPCATSGDALTDVTETNLPPYYTVYFLRRTARLYYKV